jgi:hypothetical protein
MLSSSSAAKSLYCLCKEFRLEKCETAGRYGSHITMDDIFFSRFSSTIFLVLRVGELQATEPIMKS